MKFKHLDETGYTYRQHFCVSMRWSVSMFKLSACAFIHAFIPDLCTDTVSKSILAYAEKIKNPKKI